MTDRGTVNARLEPIIRLQLRGPLGEEIELPAVIDTGYTGSLTLPADVATQLKLTRRSGGRAVLADGSVRRFDTYAAEVLWGGTWIGVIASDVGKEVLIGMSLLAGRGLWVEAVKDGAVEIRPLGSGPTAQVPTDTSS
jgi:clan AA aspartic protease